MRCHFSASGTTDIGPACSFYGWRLNARTGWPFGVHPVVSETVMAPARGVRVGASEFGSVPGFSDYLTRAKPVPQEVFSPTASVS